MNRPTLLELCRLLLADASGAAVREHFSSTDGHLPLERLLALRERALRSKASEEETALALGALVALIEGRETGEARA